MPTKKNNWNPPELTDERLKYVAIGCQECIECRRQKANQWRVRLQEELKENAVAKFVTLTFSNEELIKLIKETRVGESNAIMTIAMRRFLERWRKKYKKSVKHWAVTELGGRHDRIHVHTILFTDVENETIQKIWKYGNIWVGDYVNQKTINYIVKYMTKIDEKHKNYKSIVLTSPGIGKNYKNAERNKYNGINTKDNYILNNGQKIALPIYYRNKIYSEEEREKLWIQRIEREERYVMGERIKMITKEDELLYFRKLKAAQAKNKRIGYGDDGKEWQKEIYNISLRKLNEHKKIRDIKKI